MRCTSIVEKIRKIGVAVTTFDGRGYKAEIEGAFLCPTCS